MLPSVPGEEVHTLTIEDPPTDITTVDKPPPDTSSALRDARDPRPHFSIVFCGHVDAGKSTMSSSLMHDLGSDGERGRARHGVLFGSTPYGYDVYEEDRQRASTFGVGRGYFETSDRRITLFDGGYRGFASLMAAGTVHVDIAILVISARMGEFEAGFERGGQTQEHIKLLRNCCVRNVICVVNKMDCLNRGPAWSAERYDYILGKLRPFLQDYDFREDNGSLAFIPTSALANINLIASPKDKLLMPWYSNGPCLMDYINGLTLVDTRSEEDVLAVTLIESINIGGGITTLVGRCESGSFVVGDTLQILPSKVEVVVESIQVEGIEQDRCHPRDNVDIRVRGLSGGDVGPVRSGDVLTSISTSLRAVEYIQARVTILTNMQAIVSKGSRFMMHIHTAQEDVVIHELLALVDKKVHSDGTPILLKKKPLFAKAGDTVMVRLELGRPLVVEEYTTFDKMARFMLREDSNRYTVAFGYCTKLYESTKAQLVQQDQQ